MRSTEPSGIFKAVDLSAGWTYLFVPSGAGSPYRPSELLHMMGPGAILEEYDGIKELRNGKRLIWKKRFGSVGMFFLEPPSAEEENGYPTVRMAEWSDLEDLIPF